MELLSRQNTYLGVLFIIWIDSNTLGGFIIFTDIIEHNWSYRYLIKVLVLWNEVKSRKFLSSYEEQITKI